MTYHPAAVAIYYIILLIIAVSTKNPFIIALVLIAVAIHYACCQGLLKTLKNTIYYLILTVLLIVLSGAFKHNGVTPLFFWNEQAVTKEALIWGCIIGFLCMLISFLLKNSSKALPMDRVLYVTRIIWPTIGIYCSLALRFIPAFKKRLTLMHATQKSIGYYATASVVDQLLGYVKTSYECATWSFEQCFHKSDVMKGRGFYLKKKTTYIFYKWRLKDSLVTLITVVFFGIFILFFNESTFYYFPNTKELYVPKEVCISVTIIAILPIVIEIKEIIAWRYYNSKM